MQIPFSLGQAKLKQSKRNLCPYSITHVCLAIGVKPCDPWHRMPKSPLNTGLGRYKCKFIIYSTNPEGLVNLIYLSIFVQPKKGSFHLFFFKTIL